MRNVLEWSQQARPGERIVYHQGETSPDKATRDAAQAAHDDGLVFLGQRRTARGFAYEATRISARTARALGLVRPERVPA